MGGFANGREARTLVAVDAGLACGAYTNDNENCILVTLDAGSVFGE